ncbi:hypothetical protein LMG29542_01406 [Paraburkholderia humisilvae]|uniref:Uncharacterized protein n=1 Tax=Paraburkholderia humisilvae TaxID=627669 RepID=A0A6J5DAW8_9BURK|nr:hypothetical protein LMG29542_01406 [Paraburkholderia humisilvae]
MLARATLHVARTTAECHAGGGPLERSAVRQCSRESPLLSR